MGPKTKQKTLSRSAPRIGGRRPFVSCQIMRNAAADIFRLLPRPLAAGQSEKSYFFVRIKQFVDNLNESKSWSTRNEEKNRTNTPSVYSGVSSILSLLLLFRFFLLNPFALLSNNPTLHHIYYAKLDSNMVEFLIAFRETLEASLIVGILFVFLTKQKDKGLTSSLWLWVVAAIVWSLAVAQLFLILDTYIATTPYQKLFEWLLMFVTAGFLLYTLVRLARGEYKIRNHAHDTTTTKPWCLSCEIHPQSKWLKKSTKKSIKMVVLESASQTLSWAKSVHRGIFWLVFFAILREWFETVLLLWAASKVSWTFSYSWFFLGMIVAIVIWYMFVIWWRRVHIRRFFSTTSVLLVFFAAGMVAYGVHEVEEYLVDTGAIDGSSIVRVWDILEPRSDMVESESTRARSRNESKQKRYHILHDKGFVGVIAKWLVWYNSDPNIVEFMMWLMTLVFGWGLLRREVIN